MAKNIWTYLLAGLGGAALGWTAARFFSDGAAESPGTLAPAPAVPVGRSLREPAEEATAIEPTRVPPPSSNDQVPVVTPSSPAVGTRSNPIVVNAPPASRGEVTDLPSRRDGEPEHARPADELLNASRISCEFGAGNNTGMRSGELLTVGGGAQWRGGLILYDVLDAGADQARMSGNPGVTGTANGETNVQLLISGTRLMFFAELPDGVFVVTTIYAELDSLGRHLAVMSRHEQPSFTYAAQFLGTCQ